ncbi:23S rRNA (adenine(2030)-N(6))-methyltransferase RlmJ [Pontivivens insulae]|uniref:Ribosomal RNA large subunit methyltransferase J n=1 Tax=Pontivivens insulae TaxID=1639689 RepID=A0A2R8A953_9RHOB|nr:23S rRNA (adenine(2030)-N(6))-methyltransferase RlmJ [Pontivivens insulae]RED18670.1 23S rRNA (adenine2030-N6)-methyltransferase [Pontivivens insulae]SPF28568.1 Ribosomal RNA large subunit methyltransferase J [Pontivivens insulae]
MLSYQHAYHAGGPADVHKHVILARMLTVMLRSPRPISYLETHAGRGLYDLASAETAKTREAHEGIAIANLEREPLGEVLANVQDTFGNTAYPGSPAIAALMLRDQDDMHLMELHPAEHRALSNNLPGANLQRRDGYEGLCATSVPRTHQTLILIDPSYEVKSEYVHVAGKVPQILDTHPNATILIWYPILRAARHEAMVDQLSDLAPLRHEISFDLKDGKGMTGSGMLVLNPPKGFDPGPKRLP